MTQLEAALEAILFAVGEAVPVSRLVAAADAEPAAVAYALHTLEAHYNMCGSGIELIRMEDKVQLCTRASYAPAVRRATESRRPPTLSNAALEVLTVIAYRQPVTRAYIEQLRGVDSSGTVASLLEKGIIEPCGHLDVPGRPVLFRTTDMFLRTFGISALAELPELPEWQPEEQLEMKETE